MYPKIPVSLEYELVMCHRALAQEVTKILYDGQFANAVNINQYPRLKSTPKKIEVVYVDSDNA